MTPKQINTPALYLKLLFTSLTTLVISCNSYRSFDARAEQEIGRYEAASIEIISQFDKILKLTGRDSNFYGSITLTNDSILKSSTLDLRKTSNLSPNLLAEYIFLSSDSSICFNVKHSDGFINFYRHFIIYQRKPGRVNFDFAMTHTYEIIDERQMNTNWTYVIIKQFFD